MSKEPHSPYLYFFAFLGAGVCALIAIILILILLCGFSPTASAYPENIRHGYPTCSSCHVSPTGGGALTNYGRGTSSSLATWGTETEAKALYGAAAPLPSWLALGGDQRAVGLITRSTDGPSQRQIIPMQFDVEAAVMPPSLHGITLGGSIGSYGPDHSVEYRRTYVKADISPTLSLRGGRFLPGYGVNVPDHTALTRVGLGLGEGAESYNAELAWIVPGGESILTFIYGDRTTIDADPYQGYNTVQGKEMSGMAWRQALYLGDRCQLGISYLGISNFEQWRQAYGAFLQLGITDSAYLLAEYDRKFENGERTDLAMVKAGYEIFQGLVGTAEWDTAGTAREQRAGLQWWPRPHWEFLLEERRAYTDLTYQHFTDSGVLLLHHYL